MILTDGINWLDGVLIATLILCCMGLVVLIENYYRRTMRREMGKVT